MMLKAFGRNIRSFRLKNNMTQEQVGGLAGINPKYLGEIERGEKNPTAIVIYKLAHVLNVSVSKILSDRHVPQMHERFIKEVESLFKGKSQKDIQKAIKVLEILLD